MGEVGRPHVVVLAKDFVGGRTDGVVLESAPHLPPDIVAGLHRQRVLFHDIELVVGVVHAIHEVRKPADVVLCRDDFELRETLEHPAKDQRGQRALNLVDQIHVEGADLLKIDLALLALAGDDVQRERHVKLRGGLPELVIDGAVVGRVFWR